MEDKHEYKGWLNSDSFWKRAFAVWGYHLVANLVIGALIATFFIGIVLILGISFAALFSN